MLFDKHLRKMSPRLLSTKTANDQVLLVILQLFSDTFSLNTNHHPQHLASLSLNYTAAGILLLASQTSI